LRHTSAALALCASLFATSALAQAAPAPATYIQAGALLDRPGQTPRGPSTVIVRGGRIEAIKDGYVTPEAGARVIDLKDQFVLPGLIDAHVHMFSDNDKMEARLEATTRDIEGEFLVGVENARLDLEAGFTTVRDLSSPPRSIVALRDGILKGQIPGPTIVPAGHMISVTGGHGDGANGLNRVNAGAAREEADYLCDGPESCRRAVRNQISQGAEVIKFAATGGVLSNVSGGLSRQMFDDEMVAIVQTAHSFGRKVAVHAHAKDGIDGALRAGADSIEHATYADAESIALFKKTGAYLVPTMVAYTAALDQARAGSRPPAVLAKAEEAAKIAFTNHAAQIRAGVKIAFGTDTGVSAHGQNAREFKMLVEAGMSPAEAIRAATVSAADLLGRADRIGTLEPGKDADIIAVAKNPLADVTELERVRFVMRRGQVDKLGGARQGFPAN